MNPSALKSSTTDSRSSSRITTLSPCAVGTVTHAQVELLALHAHHDAAVLRQATLGDVELGHDLDARDHRGGQVGGRRFGFLEHAVDAVAHLQAVLERFDVDVGGAHLDRALDDQVDQADDRRFGGEVAQVLDVVLVAGARRRRCSRRSRPSRCGPGRNSARSGRRFPNAGRPDAAPRGRSPGAPLRAHSRPADRRPAGRCPARPRRPDRRGCFRNAATAAAFSGGASGQSLADNSGRPSTSLAASAMSRSDTRPSRTSRVASEPPASACRRRARARSMSLSRPRPSRAAAMRSSRAAAASYCRRLWSSNPAPDPRWPDFSSLDGVARPSARALWNSRIHGESSPHSAGCQLICTLRCTRSGCGISMVLRPSRAGQAGDAVGRTVRIGRIAAPRPRRRRRCNAARPGQRLRARARRIAPRPSPCETTTGMREPAMPRKNSDGDSTTSTRPAAPRTARCGCAGSAASARRRESGP